MEHSRKISHARCQQLRHAATPAQVTKPDNQRTAWGPPRLLQLPGVAPTGNTTVWHKHSGHVLLLLQLVLRHRQLVVQGADDLLLRGNLAASCEQVALQCLQPAGQTTAAVKRWLVGAGGRERLANCHVECPLRHAAHRAWDDCCHQAAEVNLSRVGAKGELLGGFKQK